jgi:cytochrome P450
MAADDRFTQDYRQTREDQRPSARGKVVTGPVSDWAIDFSHVEPEWAADPYPIQDELRRRCPIAHTERFGGAWLPTRYEDVTAIAYDSERFSSRAIIVSNFRPARGLAPVGTSPPISSDPPFHHDARKLLPAFTKTTVTKQEPAIGGFCHALIDAFEGRDVVDAARDYAQHIPVRVIADMLGFPPEDGPQFREFVEDLLEGINLPPDERIARVSRLFDYLLAQVQDHPGNPRDDLTTYLINAELYGRKLDPSHVVGAMALLLIAGVDTTWSAIGASLWHLAKTPGDRQRLAAEPGLLPTAIEEFLRAYAPVTMARLVKRDMRWRGVDMKADDWILLSFPAANRDPAQFDRAGEVVIDREVNRHAAFGLGIHRCVGSHLARMELRVALEAWLDRIGSFILDDPSAVTWSAGQIRGPRTLPLRIHWPPQHTSSPTAPRGGSRSPPPRADQPRRIATKTQAQTLAIDRCESGRLGLPASPRLPPNKRQNGQIWAASAGPTAEARSAQNGGSRSG